jgi:hypothetical protein
MVFAEEFPRSFLEGGCQAINDDSDGARRVHPERSCSNEVGLHFADFALAQISDVKERRHELEVLGHELIEEVA